MSPGKRRLDRDVDLDVRLDADRAAQHRRVFPTMPAAPSVWSVVSCVSLPLAEAVAPAVADVRDVDALIVRGEVRGDDRRPHSRVGFVLLRRREDALVGQQGRAAQAGPPAAAGAAPARAEARRAERLADRVDAELAGDLARGVPAHPVGDDEEVVILEDRVRVLVVLSLEARVGSADRRDQDERVRARSALLPPRVPSARRHAPGRVGRRGSRRASAASASPRAS